MNLSIEGLIQKDKLVISNGLDENISVAIVLAGGYAVDVNETVKIHCNTVKVALKIQNDRTRLRNQI